MRRHFTASIRLGLEAVFAALPDAGYFIADERPGRPFTGRERPVTPARLLHERSIDELVGAMEQQAILLIRPVSPRYVHLEGVRLDALIHLQASALRPSLLLSDPRRPLHVDVWVDLGQEVEEDLVMTFVARLLRRPLLPKNQKPRWSGYGRIPGTCPGTVMPLPEAVKSFVHAPAEFVAMAALDLSERRHALAAEIDFFRCHPAAGIDPPRPEWHRRKARKKARS